MKVWAPQKIFKQQPPAVLDQPNPVQNTWYTVLESARDVRIILIVCGVLTTDETIALRLTVDGVVRTWTLAATAGQTNYVGLMATLTGILLQYTTVASLLMYRSFMVEGRNVKVEIRKTTAAGTGNLQCLVDYAQLS